MATSGSYNFSLTASEAIKEALVLVNAIRFNEAVSGSAMSSHMKTLNMMLKGWQADGIALWKRMEVALFQSLNGFSYTIGPSGSHAADEYVKTEVLTAASSGDGTIDVDTIDGMTNGDNIGIELDDGTLQWTTINGVPAGSTVTLTAVLTDDVAVNNHIYTYTNLTQRPIEILEGRVVNSDGTDTTLTPLSLEEYVSLSTKSSPGTANQYYFSPTLTNSEFKLWPACADVKNYILMTNKVQVEDMDSVSDNFDFPPEWSEAIVNNLAIRLGPKYNKPVPQEVIAVGLSSYQMLKGFDMEENPIFFKVKLS